MAGWKMFCRIFWALGWFEGGSSLGAQNQGQRKADPRVAADQRPINICHFLVPLLSGYSMELKAVDYDSIGFSKSRRLVFCRSNKYLSRLTATFLDRGTDIGRELKSEEHVAERGCRDDSVMIV